MSRYCQLDWHLTVDARLKMVSLHLLFSDHGIDPFSLCQRAVGFAVILDGLRLDICNKRQSNYSMYQILCR